MKLFDDYWAGYYGSVPSGQARESAINSVRKAFLLDSTLDSRIKKDLATDLIPEVIGVGAGFGIWAGQR